MIAGGASSEREISLRSGTAVLGAMSRAGVDARLVDPGSGGVASVDFRNQEVAFLALHGQYGEDGRCQADLEVIGVPYTGCDSRCSEMAFDKAQAKSVAAASGVAVAQGGVWTRGQAVPDVALPVVIKPCREGSSVGLSIARTADQLRQQLSASASHGPLLVEQFVDGAEWTVAVFNGTAFPPLLIEHGREMFDFAAKYEGASTKVSVAGDRHNEVSERLSAVAESLFGAFDADGLVRFDFIWDRTAPVFLELNTLPGFTEQSLAPQAAAAAGCSFEDLCLLMLADAVARR